MVSKYSPYETVCQFCNGVFKRTGIRRHQISCVKNPELIKFRPALAGKLLMPCREASKGLKEQVLIKIEDDMIKDIVLADGVIMLYGNKKYQGQTGQEDNENISDRIRELGMLFRSARRKDPDLLSLLDLMQSSHWNLLIESVREVAEYKIDNSEFGKPSLVKKLRRSLTKCAELQYQESFRWNNKEIQIVTETFLQRIRLHWKNSMNPTTSSVEPDEKEIELSSLKLEDDVVKLKEKLESKVENLLHVIDENLPKYYPELTKACFAQVILLNMERGRYVEKVTVGDYQKAKTRQTHYVDELKLTAFEKKLCTSHLVIEVSIKKDETIPIMMTQGMVSSTETLLKYRESIGLKDSEYLYAEFDEPKEHYKGIEIIQDFADSSNFHKPTIFMESKSFKQISTIFQVINLKDFNKTVIEFLRSNNVSEDRIQFGSLLHLAKISKIIDTINSAKSRRCDSDSAEVPQTEIIADETENNTDDKETRDTEQNKGNRSVRKPGSNSDKDDVLQHKPEAYGGQTTEVDSSDSDGEPLVPVRWRRKSRKIKRHACVYCKMFFTKISRHIALMHKKEKEVIRILAMPKCSKERKNAWQVLVNKATFSNYKETLNRSSNRSNQQRSSLLPCQFCKGIYRKTYLYHHQKLCKLKNPQIHSAEYRPTFAGKLLMTHKTTSKMLQENIIDRMKDDDLKAVIMSDNVVLRYGNMQFESEYDIEQRNIGISNKMKELARLVLIAKSRKETITSVTDLFVESEWDLLIESVKAAAAYNEETGRFDKPSLAKRLRLNIKRCAEMEYFECFGNDNTEKQNIINTFLKKYDQAWEMSMGKDSQCKSIVTSEHSLKDSGYSKSTVDDLDYIENQSSDRNGSPVFGKNTSALEKNNGKSSPPLGQISRKNSTAFRKISGRNSRALGKRSPVLRKKSGNNSPELGKYSGKNGPIPGKLSGNYCTALGSYSGKNSPVLGKISGKNSPVLQKNSGNSLEIENKIPALGKNEISKPSICGLVKDVIKVIEALESRANELCAHISEEPSKFYSELAKVCLAQITLLNMRRYHIVQKLTMPALNDAKLGKDSGMLKDGLTLFEVKLCTSCVIVGVKSIQKEIEPIMLTEKIVQNVDTLTQFRETVGLKNQNLLFARPEFSRHPYRGIDVLQEFANDNGLQFSDEMVSTKLKKLVDLVSKIVIVNIRDQDVKDSFNSNDIKGEIETALKITRIRKRLQNVQTDAKGDTNDELEYSELETIYADSGDEIEDDAASSTSSLDKTRVASDFADSSDSEDGEFPVRKSKQFRRTPWSEDEKSIALTAFDQHRLLKKLPGKRECQRLIVKNKALKNRSWTMVKHFIRNTILADDRKLKVDQN